MTALSGPAFFIGTPSRDTVPFEGDSRPAIIFSRVVFPHPEGPITLTNSPSSIAKLIPCNVSSEAVSNLFDMFSRIKPIFALHAVISYN
jgi:hypothetical protein